MQQKTATNVLWYGESSCLLHCKHLYSWGKLLRQLAFHQEFKRSHNETDVRKYLGNWCPNNQMRSMEWKQLTGKTLHGNSYLWLVMKKSSVFSTQKSTYFQILYCSLERWTRPSNQIMHGKTDWRGSKVHLNTEPWIELMVSEFNSSGISSQYSPHCSSATKFKSYCWDWVKHQRILQDELSSCRCSTTYHGDRKTTRKNANQLLNSFLYMPIRFGGGQWSFFGPGSAEKMMITLAETGHPVFRATSPLSRGVLTSKGGGKLSIHYCADLETITTVFSTITSVNQLSLYGAVAEMCE